MAVLSSGGGRLYGSKDESNGRVNPALEPDYDMETRYPEVANSMRETDKHVNSKNDTCQTQYNTAF